MKVCSVLKLVDDWEAEESQISEYVLTELVDYWESENWEWKCDQACGWLCLITVPLRYRTTQRWIVR